MDKVTPIICLLFNVGDSPYKRSLCSCTQWFLGAPLKGRGGKVKSSLLLSYKKVRSLPYCTIPLEKKHHLVRGESVRDTHKGASLIPSVGIDGWNVNGGLNEE